MSETKSESQLGTANWRNDGLDWTTRHSGSQCERSTGHSEGLPIHQRELSPVPLRQIPKNGSDSPGWPLQWGHGSLLLAQMTPLCPRETLSDGTRNFTRNVSGHPFMGRLAADSAGRLPTPTPPHLAPPCRGERGGRPWPGAAPLLRGPREASSRSSGGIAAPVGTHECQRRTSPLEGAWRERHWEPSSRPG